MSEEIPIPNPGTKEAIEAGCKCPVMDNCHGTGWHSSGEFVYNMDCPLHSYRFSQTGQGDEPQ